MTNKLQFFEAGPSFGKAPQQLVIFLHGYGSNGRDLLSLTNEFCEVLPNAHFISPNAPFDFEAPIDYGFQWFSLLSSDPKAIFPQIIQANDILDEFIKSQLKRFSLQYKDLILVGFSQGSMMAMYNSLRSKEEIGGLVAYSGKLILPSDLSEEVNSKPKMCLIHGTDDQVVPFEHLQRAGSLLKDLKVKHETHSIKGLGHTIDMKGIDIAKKFLSKL
ncbi:MAG: dienelactone hydrolase family protein [Proteobacteria bacterium]|nr:dienelactone hydrolase family protein [Pseudomonadota bacterium]